MESFAECAVYLNLKTLKMDCINGKIITDIGTSSKHGSHGCHSRNHIREEVIRMGWRNEQCRKVCRIIDNFLANRPTERDSLIVAVQKAFDALKRSEWVLCSERLPENGRQVLVFARSVHFALAKYDEMREADGTYKMQWVTFDAWKPFYKIKDVIAWMELPKPYQEGGADMRGDKHGN